MDFLKTRKTAIIITLITALLATVVAVQKTTTRLTRNIEAMFYNGVYLDSQGYLQPSIASQLNKIIDTTLNLTTLIRNNDNLSDASEALLQARKALIDASSIKNKEKALTQIDDALTVLNIAAQSSNLNEREREAFALHMQSYNGAKSFIINTLAPTYNEKVDAYIAERSFIAALMSSVKPEKFFVEIYK